MESLLPILSGTLRDILREIRTKTENPIAVETLEVDDAVKQYNGICYYLRREFGNSILEKCINSRITDEVRMLAIRPREFEISFLPKGKEPEYITSDTWGRKNRQSGKVARIFQRLLKKEFKTRDWEIFSNLFKAEVCHCSEFELVCGEDIRTWYNEENYYKIAGTLGNSCMRGSECSSYFDIYVENAEMLITKKDNLLTGRAIVWTIGDKVLLDRIYTCFDYLENCFIDYAKEHKWYIRENNSMLRTGDCQGWYSPDDNYTEVCYPEFRITLKHKYNEFPYVDSFRYYDGNREISTYVVESPYTLDCTDGTTSGNCIWTCNYCGREYYGTDDECPNELHYSEYEDEYYCDHCCWYCTELEDYFRNSDSPCTIYEYKTPVTYPNHFIYDNYVEEPDGSECGKDVVLIDGEYHFVTNNLIFNQETKQYEIRSDSN